MSRYWLQDVHARIEEADSRRFSEQRYLKTPDTVDLKVAAEVIARFGWWFVGGARDWASQWGDAWLRRPQRPLNPSQVASHVARETSPGPARSYEYTLHTICKKSRWNRRPYYWTRFVLIDLDLGIAGESDLIKRYEICRRLFGTPIVLRSPGGGLHLIWPLAHPMSVFGLVDRVPSGGGPVLIADMLREAGVEIRPGNAELFPSFRRRIRLPLGGSVQLDPVSLQPLGLTTRDQEVTRLVSDMDRLATASPLDPRRLARRLVLSRRSSQGGGSPNKTERRPAAGHGTPDVGRLLGEGLHEGVTRNEAAKALARHWMLRRGWSGSEVVSALLEWTRTHSNGLSKQASSLHLHSAERELEGEYRRIVAGIERALSRGWVTRRSSEARFVLTPDDLKFVFSRTEMLARADRYWAEVFLFCLIGFARQHGKFDRDGDALVELSSTMMQRWPRCGGNKYSRRLLWAQEQGLITEERSYRAPASGIPGRARQYRLRLASPPNDWMAGMDTWAASQAVRREKARRVHPQQTQHALEAWQRFGPDLERRYGNAAVNRIRRLVTAYDEQVEQSSSIAVA